MDASGGGSENNRSRMSFDPLSHAHTLDSAHLSKFFLRNGYGVEKVSVFDEEDGKVTTHIAPLGLLSFMKSTCFLERPKDCREFKVDQAMPDLR